MVVVRPDVFRDGAQQQRVDKAGKHGVCNCVVADGTLLHITASKPWRQSHNNSSEQRQTHINHPSVELSKRCQEAAASTDCVVIGCPETRVMASNRSLVPPRRVRTSALAINPYQRNPRWKARKAYLLTIAIRRYKLVRSHWHTVARRIGKHCRYNRMSYQMLLDDPVLHEAMLGFKEGFEALQNQQELCRRGLRHLNRAVSNCFRLCHWLWLVCESLDTDRMYLPRAASVWCFHPRLKAHQDPFSIIPFVHWMAVGHKVLYGISSYP